MIALTVFFMSNVPVYSDDVQNSKIVKGTEKLIGDVTTWLMVLAPVVSGLLIIYFFIRRSAADEMDQKMWGKRISNAWICAAVAVAGSGLVQLIMSYFGGSVT